MRWMSELIKVYICLSGIFNTFNVYLPRFRPFDQPFLYISCGHFCVLWIAPLQHHIIIRRLQCNLTVSAPGYNTLLCNIQTFHCSSMKNCSNKILLVVVVVLYSLVIQFKITFWNSKASSNLRTKSVFHCLLNNNNNKIRHILTICCNCILTDNQF